MSAFVLVTDAQSGHGGTTEVIAHIEPPTEETQPSPTNPPAPDADKLTVTALRPDSAAFKEQSFVYAVTGPQDTFLTVTVVLPAGATSGSVVIAQLPPGEYRVTEQCPWSWRYSDGGTQSAVVGAAPAAAVFDHTLDRLEWLGGYSHRN